MEPRNTQNTRKDFLYRDESYLLRGAVHEVFREMGCGFLEAVYQECLEKELRNQNIPFVSQPELELFYKQEKLQLTYKPDLICYSKIVVEIKAVKEICDEHRVQLHNYLKASRLQLGFLVNFGHYPKATIERIIK
ncbi:MAG: GxxExxY protein [Kiritimatiellia bacterium]|jgi:GxxExxY protein